MPRYCTPLQYAVLCLREKGHSKRNSFKMAIFTVPGRKNANRIGQKIGRCPGPQGWHVTWRLSNLVAHDCGYPLSRYTCRATRVAADFLDFIACCRCSSGVAPHPLKILVSLLSPPHSREVSHRNLGLRRCHATRGCRSYSCRCRATLCN